VRCVIGFRTTRALFFYAADLRHVAPISDFNRFVHLLLHSVVSPQFIRRYAEVVRLKRRQ
jgi:hypothetical protein